MVGFPQNLILLAEEFLSGVVKIMYCVNNNTMQNSGGIHRLIWSFVSLDEVLWVGCGA